ncbi:uncharacterized protein LOC120908665 [Anopheles arabiensis]|uniref:uncharacterized protein LOC120908665 n=1 Tax=Anopheles arabiensis TaxID=7173 RepID=UPI001AAD0164|nr:uncharacterized protein LOC120908665 [Anopheles arabiensis]
MEPKARRLRLVGYCVQEKAYRLVDTSSDRIVISRDVIFNEASASSEQGNSGPAEVVEFDVDSNRYQQFRPDDVNGECSPDDVDDECSIDDVNGERSPDNVDDECSPTDEQEEEFDSAESDENSASSSDGQDEPAATSSKRSTRGGVEPHQYYR